jgi:hypothetical protein
MDIDLAAVATFGDSAADRAGGPEPWLCQTSAWPRGAMPALLRAIYAKLDTVKMLILNFLFKLWPRNDRRNLSFRPAVVQLKFNRASVTSRAVTARRPRYVMMRESTLRAFSPPVVRGRPFIKGNPGRKVGSVNRVTKVAAALLADEAGALVRKAIDLAVNGDVAMLKFLLGRVLPRERPIKIELPDLDFADDAVEATATIMRAVAEGNISPSEGAALTTIVKANREAIELADAVKRLDVLEEKMKGKT